MTRMAALLSACLCASGMADAAPFCVQTQIVPPQCIYFDANSCNQRANQLKGSCTGNPDDVKVRRGAGGFCIADSRLRPECAFADLDSCLREANRRHAACLVAPDSTPSSRSQDANSTPQGGGQAQTAGSGGLGGSGLGASGLGGGSGAGNIP